MIHLDAVEHERGAAKGAAWLGRWNRSSRSRPLVTTQVHRYGPADHVAEVLVVDLHDLDT